jgi:signal transduction histidine kinase
MADGSEWSFPTGSSPNETLRFVSTGTFPSAPEVTFRISVPFQSVAYPVAKHAAWYLSVLIAFAFIIRRLILNWQKAFAGQIQSLSSNEESSIFELQAALDARQIAQSTIEKQKVRIELSEQVAHDIRAPLALVKAISKGLANSHQEESELLSSASIRLDELITDLRSTTSKKAEESSSEDITEIVRAFRRTTPTSIHNSGDKSLMLRIPKSVFRRIVTNLVQNAIECPVPGTRRQSRPTYWTTPDLVAVS